MNSDGLREWILEVRNPWASEGETLVKDQKSFFDFALGVCANREAKYHGLWQQYGYRGCLGHLESKVARIRRAVEQGTIEDDVDDIVDLANYTGFMGRLVAFGMVSNIQEGEEEFYSQVKEAATDPIKRARILEMLGVNGGVSR